MLRSLFLLSGFFFLIGCESDFDKCMNAELPRAEAGLGPEIEEAQAHLTATDRLISRAQSFDEITKPVRDWINQNPLDPPYPSLTCETRSENWDQCYEAHTQAVAQWEIDVQPWRDRRKAVLTPLLPALKTAGFEGSTYEELLESVYKGLTEPYENATVARGQELDCWGREECEGWLDVVRAEGKHVFGEDFSDYESPEYQAWLGATPERVKQHFVDKIASIKANAPEIAALMCNRAGIYE